MKKQWILGVCAILLVINLVFTGLVIYGVLPKEAEKTSRYTLYIGLNDKDSNVQVIPVSEALDIVSEICVDYVPGYTAMTGHGGWLNDAGEFIREETLIFTIIDAEEESILKIKDEVMKALNQSSIMMEYQEVSSTI